MLRNCVALLFLILVVSNVVPFTNLTINPTVAENKPSNADKRNKCSTCFNTVPQQVWQVPSSETGSNKTHGLGWQPSEILEGTRIKPQTRAAGLPTSFDWRTYSGYNWMTSVKDQLGCGSCVAFASVGALEAKYRIQTNNPSWGIDLSEQHLFSCGGGNCVSGISIPQELNYLRDYGTPDEACNPYEAVDNNCGSSCSDWKLRAKKISSWNGIPANSTDIETAVLDGPLVAGIVVYEDFYGCRKNDPGCGYPGYQPGEVYHHTGGLYVGGHAVAIVGYDSTQQYWICKNSWGSSWGDSGYFRIGFGECGIEQSVASITASSADTSKILLSSTRDGSEEIYVMNSDGSSQTRLTYNAIEDNYPALSLDGSKIAFARAISGVYNIFVMDADGSDVVQLTSHPTADASDLWPAWSPDGSKIAFVKIKNDAANILVMKADGTNVVQLTADAMMVDYKPDWSPDGSKIAFTSYRDGHDEIFTMNADGSNQVQLTFHTADHNPSWSPDGNKIAFTRRLSSKNFEIYTMNADGSGQTQLTFNKVNDDYSAWSPDGSKIAFYSTRDGNAEIYTMNADGSDQTRLTNNPAVDAYPSWHFSIAADHPPALTHGYVGPSSGITSTSFSYYADYSDPEGAGPSVKRVWVDGGSHDMLLYSGLASSGTYRYQTTLSSGSHNYYFEFSDGTNTVRLPSSGAYSGPTVSSTSTIIFQANGVGSDASGTVITIDSVGYSYSQLPQSYAWTVGSTHTIAASSPVNAGSGKQYVWTSWSDGGAQTHAYTTPSSSQTVTASYKTQYYCIMQTSGSGSVLPSSGWWDAGSPLQIQATPTSPYTWGSWTGIGSGSYSGTNNPASVTVNGPITETANFNTAGTIFVPSGNLASNPLGRVFFVFNEKKYYITNPAAFTSYGFSWADVKTSPNPDNYQSSQIYYDYLLDGKIPLPNRPYIAGDVNDGSLYYIPYYTWNGQKYPISGAGYSAYTGALKKLPIRYGDPAMSLTASLTVLDGVNPIPWWPSPGYVIGKNPLGRVFFIFNGQKYYFIDWTAYTGYAFKSTDINPSVNPDSYPNAQVSFDYLLEDLTSVLRKPLPNQPYIVGDVNEGSLYWTPYYTWTGEKYPITGGGYNGYSGQLKNLHTRYGDPSINLPTSSYILDGTNPLPQLVS